MLIAFTRNNNNTGRKTLHGHWLLWIKNLSKLREMLFHHNKEAQEAARKEFIAYIDSVMSASYTDNALRVEYECNAGNNDTTNVVVEEEDGNSNKKSVVEDHFYDFKDDSPNKLEDLQRIRNTRNKAKIHEIGGKILHCYKSRSLFTTNDILDMSLYHHSKEAREDILLRHCLCQMNDLTLQHTDTHMIIRI